MSFAADHSRNSADTGSFRFAVGWDGKPRSKMASLNYLKF